MEGKGALLKQQHVVYSYEVDMRGFIKPSILLSYMLESAWNHVRSTDFSYSRLLAEGQLWAASRLLIIFNRLPKWNDEITVETWGKGIDRFFALRDFVVRSSTQEKLAVATSAWLIIDRTTLRPQKLDKLRETFPFHPGNSALDVKLQKLHPVTEGKIRTRSIVRYTDLDVNRHVIASRYMRWILDSFSADILEGCSLKSFEIDFLSEAKLEDEIAVAIQPDYEYYLCTISRESDGAELCRARLTWGDFSTSPPP
jgi:medium-chain acyl-[acyl-carrier-protein] hydrolase